MQYRELAPGYEISRIVHGGWQFSAGHRLDAAGFDSAVDVLMASAELGIDTFDCADIYTGVEELYGRFLRRWATTSATRPIRIHTKLVPDWAELDLVDRDYVRRVVHRSLERLGVERLDLVQFYWWRDEIPGMEDAAGWLLEMCDEGKVGHFGVTNLDVERLARLEAAGAVPVANQVQYSLLDRRPEGGLVEHARGRGMGLLAFGGLAGGFLTDRWLGAPPPEEAANRSLVKYRLIVDEFGGWKPYQALLAELRAIADRHETDVAAVALRWVLDRSGVAAAIVGATRLGQMERNVRALDVTLSAAEQAAIDRHLAAAPGPGGPVFGLERDRDGPHGRIMRYDLNAEPE